MAGLFDVHSILGDSDVSLSSQGFCYRNAWSGHDSNESFLRPYCRTLAFGHLLAVITKHIVGVLEGHWLLFYVIGFALALPSWWLIYHARSLYIAKVPDNRKTLLLNSGVVLTLSVLGLHNLPLAVTGLLNIAYHLHSRRIVGWAIVGLAIVVNMILFIGSIIFFASGQSFEQFQGME